MGPRNRRTDGVARRARLTSGKVETHDHPPGCRVADLLESGVGEDAAAADVQLPPGDVLIRFHEHRVALERPGAAAPREVDGGPNDGPADPSAPVPGPGEDAGYSP